MLRTRIMAALAVDTTRQLLRKQILATVTISASSKFLSSSVARGADSTGIAAASAKARKNVTMSCNARQETAGSRSTAQAISSSFQLQLDCNLFDGPHHPQRIATIDFSDVRRRVAFLQQSPRQVWKLRNILESDGDTADAIVIAADADRLDAGNLDDMVDVGDDGFQASRWQYRQIFTCIYLYLHDFVASASRSASADFCERKALLKLI